MPSLTGPDGAPELIAQDRVRSAGRRDSIAFITFISYFTPTSTFDSVESVPCGHAHGRESHRQVLQTAFGRAISAACGRGPETRGGAVDEVVAARTAIYADRTPAVCLSTAKVPPWPSIRPTSTLCSIHASRVER